MDTLLLTLFLLPAATGAEALIEEGISLREKGKDLEALAKFEAAYAESKSPKALTQVALAEQALGRWISAEAHLTDALKNKDAWIEKRRAPLEGALATIRERLGRLEVLGTPAGAKVLLNGKDVGVLPLKAPMRVVAGTIAVDVLADGHRPTSRNVVVNAGSLARETINLVPELAKAEPPPPPPATPPLPTTGTTTDVSSGPNLMIWGVVSGAAALAGIGVGAAGLAIRNSNINSYNDDSICLVDGKTRDENCGDKLDSANTGEAMAIGGFVAGGALAVTSVLLFLFDGDDEVTAMNGPGDIGVSVRARF